jgi:DNA-binding NarL/FixJ family response regulator
MNAWFVPPIVIPAQSWDFSATQELRESNGGRSLVFFKTPATAASEAEAVIAAARYAADLMIVDAGLGRGSGVSAVEEILRAGPLAHVFVTGDAEGVRVRKPDAVIVHKPFREAALARAIDAALTASPKPERLYGSGHGH